MSLDAPDVHRFATAVAELAGSDADVQAALNLGRRVLGNWSEAGRGYHSAEHLAEVIARLDELAPAGVPAARSPAVILAAWFHDAVYRGRPGADEQDSAALAAATLPGLGVDADGVAEVSRLVLLTREHRPADGDVAGQALCDADLAILAAPPERYARYVQDVRREYRHVPATLFRVGRRRVLTDLLERARSGSPPLYRTVPARGWTTAAERNLSAELEALSG